MSARQRHDRLRPAIVLLLCLLASPLAAVTLTALVKQVEKSIVTISIYQGGSRVSQGSGWLISESKIVTCYHVIDGAGRIEAVTSDHRKIKVLGIASSDEEGDIAILAIEPQKGIKPLALAPSLPQVGERVYVIGSPLGLEASVTEGIVSSIRPQSSGVNLLQFTAPVAPGSSGSPVFNEKGEVVAMVTMMIKEGQGLNFGIEAARILKAQQNPVNPNPVPQNPPPHQAAPRSSASGKPMETVKGRDNPPRQQPPQPQPPRPQSPRPPNQGAGQKPYDEK